jgi:signal recognition particle receptor subunit beta
MVISDFGKMANLQEKNILLIDIPGKNPYTFMEESIA